MQNSIKSSTKVQYPRGRENKSFIVSDSSFLPDQMLLIEFLLFINWSKNSTVLSNDVFHRKKRPQQCRFTQNISRVSVETSVAF